MLDILIRNGLVCDGSGQEAFLADVGIVGEKICDIWRREACDTPPPAPEARRVIDAKGKLLTPGFVDVHSHSDLTVLVNPNSESKLRQGITTEIVGNCGVSAFPMRGSALKEESEANAWMGVEINWKSARQYMARLEKLRPAVNIATFVGHGNIRAAVVGMDDRNASPEQMQMMTREVELAMDAGALGLSTGLIYAPGLFASTHEIAELMCVVARRGGMYSSHVRGEGDELLEAAKEFFSIVRAADCQGQFSHLKSCAPRNWGKVARVIEQVEEHNARGGKVCFDKYPYIASSTTLASLLPRWVHDGGRDAAIKKFQDPQLKYCIINEAAEMNEGRDGWDSVLISDPASDKYSPFVGRTLGDIARQTGQEPGEVFLDLLAQSHLGTQICNYTMSQEETDMALLHPLGMVCTDAASRAPYGALAASTPHPRAYGSFARFMHDYVKERKLLTLEQAVAKASAWPCEAFGLLNRGLLRPGYYADLLVLDWPAFRDRASFADAHQYCDGLERVIVNGTLTLDRGEHTGQRNGHVLRRK